MRKSLCTIPVSTRTFFFPWGSFHIRATVEMLLPGLRSCISNQRVSAFAVFNIHIFYSASQWNFIAGIYLNFVWFIVTMPRSGKLADFVEACICYDEAFFQPLVDLLDVVYQAFTRCQNDHRGALGGKLAWFIVEELQLQGSSGPV